MKPSLKHPVRVLIADDHPLFLQGLRQAVENDSAFQVVEEVVDGVAALERIRALKPDLCVLDIKMPGLDGFGVMRQLQQDRFSCPVILLTMYQDQDLLNEAIGLGARGYVLKESAVTDILHCLRTVSAGRSYFSPALSDFLLAHRASVESLHLEKAGFDRLTPAERRILKLIADDRTSKEIADALTVSVHTVENHRANICAKLDLHGTHSLLRFAFAHRSQL